ncbi:MAG: metallophosphoesterase [Silanimonas sp.]
MSSPIVLDVPANTEGRDFVVGDLHGCYGKLMVALAEVSFDFTFDRLFCVGDLIDRGPQSMEVAQLIREPWFFAVRGNHEQLLFDAVRDDTGENGATLLHVQNGGGWVLDILESEDGDESELDSIVADLSRLPLAIVVDGHYAILHGEVFGDMDWPSFRARLEDGCPRAAMSAMWGRTKITAMDTSRVEGIELVYCGHTPVETIGALGNVVYTDTGICYGGRVELIGLGETRLRPPVKLKRKKG